MAGRAVAIGYEWKWPWNANSHCILENDDLLIYSPISFPCPLFSSCSHYHHGHHHFSLLLTLFSSSCFFLSCSVFLKCTFGIWFLIFPSFCLLSFSLILFTVFVLCSDLFKIRDIQIHQNFFVRAHFIWPQLFELWLIWLYFIHKEIYANYILWQTGPWKKSAVQKIVHFITNFKSKLLQP